MFASATKNAGFHALDELGHALSRIGAAFAGAQEATRIYSSLSRLSAAQLAARGLKREDISRLTLETLNTATDH